MAKHDNIKAKDDELTDSQKELIAEANTLADDAVEAAQAADDKADAKKVEAS
jgi:hypothetical protein